MSSLEYKRRRAEAQLRDEAYIEKPAGVSSDGKGGKIPGQPEIIKEPCNLSANGGGTEKGTGDRRLIKGSYRLRLRVDAEIKESWKVTVNGRAYKCVWAPPPSATALTRLVGLDDTP